MLVYYDRKRLLYILLNALKKRGFRVVIYYVTSDELLDNILRKKIEPILFLSKTLLIAERNY